MGYKPTFAEIIYDAKFEIKAVGTRAESKYYHCVFCGCRMKHFIVLRRLTDNTLWRVGRRCIGRVGLELPSKVKFIREIEGRRWILKILTPELAERHRKGEVEVKDVPKW